jgi:hypothetical protein
MKVEIGREPTFIVFRVAYYSPTIHREAGAKG